MSSSLQESSSLPRNDCPWNPCTNTMLNAANFTQQRAWRRTCDGSKDTKNGFSPKHLYQANEMANSSWWTTTSTRTTFEASKETRRLGQWGIHAGTTMNGWWSISAGQPVQIRVRKRFIEVETKPSLNRFIPERFDREICAATGLNWKYFVTCNVYYVKWCVCGERSVLVLVLVLVLEATLHHCSNREMSRRWLFPSLTLWIS